MIGTHLMLLNEWNVWCCGEDRFEVSKGGGGGSPASFVDAGEKQERCTEENS